MCHFRMSLQKDFIKSSILFFQATQNHSSPLFSLTCHSLVIPVLLFLNFLNSPVHLKRKPFPFNIIRKGSCAKAMGKQLRLAHYP